MDKSVVGALTILRHAAAVLTMQGFVGAEHNRGDSAGCRTASMLPVSRISAIGTRIQDRKVTAGFSYSFAT